MEREAFARWIAPCTLRALDVAAGQAVVEVPDDYVRAWLAERLDAVVRRTLCGVIGRPVTVTYRVR